MNAVKKENDLTKYEPKTERRDSGFFMAPKSRQRGRKPLRHMLNTFKGDPISEAHYALQRIKLVEDQIHTLMKAISPPALELVLKKRPSLTQYA
jgi:hypothetical protein